MRLSGWAGHVDRRRAELPLVYPRRAEWALFAHPRLADRSAMIAMVYSLSHNRMDDAADWV